MWFIFAAIALLLIYLVFAYSYKMWPFKKKSSNDDDIPADAKTALIRENETTELVATTIYKAEYGDPSTGRVEDVTSLIQARVDAAIAAGGPGAKTTIPVSNLSMKGDPAPGVLKTLTVIYS